MRHSRPPDNSYFHGANIDTQRDVSRETPRHAMRGWLSPPCYQDDRPPPVTVDEPCARTPLFLALSPSTNKSALLAYSRCSHRLARPVPSGSPYDPKSLITEPAPISALLAR